MSNTTPVIYSYFSTSEDPAIAKNLVDRDGVTVNLTLASFVITITSLKTGVKTTKTDGVIGAATSPNMIVTWSTGELAQLVATLESGKEERFAILYEAVVNDRARPFRPEANDFLVIKKP